MSPCTHLRPLHTRESPPAPLPPMAHVCVPSVLPVFAPPVCTDTPSPYTHTCISVLAPLCVHKQSLLTSVHSPQFFSAQSLHTCVHSPPPVPVCTCAFTPHFCTCTCVCPQSLHNERTSVLAHPCAFLCPLFLHTHAHLHPQSLHARAHLSPCTPMHVHTHPLHVHVPCTTAPYLHTQHLHGNVCPHARVSLRGGGGKVTMRGPHGTPGDPR